MSNTVSNGSPFPMLPRDEGWKKLSIREKIGQTAVVVGSPGKFKTQYGSIEAYLEKYPVGGIFFFPGKLTGDRKDDRIENIREAVGEFRAASRSPMLFVGDFEYGGGELDPTLCTMPYLMALGATRSAELAAARGRAVGREARYMGIQWIFAPCCDININPFNPLVNTRSVSDDPDLALRLLSAQIGGIQEEGVAACAKHFPGDGVDYRDQHMCVTYNSLPMEQWRQIHGKVFQGLISAGVHSIMTGHIALPDYQDPSEQADGVYLPATLSRDLNIRLLKEEMGFNGVIVSDALCMGGFRGIYEPEVRGEIECFKAGTDVVLWPSLEYFDAMERAIASGEIGMERLDDAVARVWAMKERLGLFDSDYASVRELSAEEKADGFAISEQIAENSLTLLKDRRKQLPISPATTKKVLLAAITPHLETYGRMSVLRDELIQRGFDVTMQRNIEYEQVGWEDHFSHGYDLIIYAVSRVSHRPIGPPVCYADEAHSIWASLSHKRHQSLVVMFGNPYLADDYFQAADLVINAYADLPSTLKAVARAICGEIPFRGVSPIKLKTLGTRQ